MGHEMIDLLVVSVPVLDLQYPPSSPAIIKACAQAAGFSARTLDLNIELLQLAGTREAFYQVQYTFENVDTEVIDTADPVLAFFNGSEALVRQWVDHSVALITQQNPRWLGISVFSYKSHKAVLLLCVELRRHLPDLKIVLGGRGASAYFLGPEHTRFVDKIKSFLGPYPWKNFSETLLHYKLTDTIIQGDGEQAIVDLLNGDVSNSLTGDTAAINLEKLPFVDFDDYDLSAYDYVNEPIIPITGSKGCVRKCTFCDIPVLWPKFKFRSGQHIAEEMIHLYQRHGVKKFYMSDSLVNGSLVAFRDFIETLSTHNTQHPGAEIKWVGQYITKARTTAQDDHFYDMLKASGGEGLTIGVESGSDAVRKHMKKQFTTEDIDWELHQFDQRGIVCVLLFFSSYPTETWEDFLQTVHMFMRYQKYCASGTVYKITLGVPYKHHAQTPLWNMQEEIGLITRKNDGILWHLTTNPDLTFFERCRRRLILQEVATALRLPMSRNTPELNEMIDSLRLHRKELEDFFPHWKTTQAHEDRHKLLGDSAILMPPEIQQLVNDHLKMNPTLAEQILNKHTNINDDIQFDNEQYQILKNMLLEIK